MNFNPSPLIVISVSEVSGDLLGAHLIRAIEVRCPNARFTGIDGEHMKAESFEGLCDQEELAVHGFVEVIRRLPQILEIRRGLVNDLLCLKPDVFIDIDTLDFDLSVAGRLKQVGTHIIHYVSPSVWAWRCERVSKIVHRINRVLCLFPVEPQLYIDVGGKAKFVGHPMAQTMPVGADRAAARQKLGVPADVSVFAILPDSHVNGIDYVAAVFFQTALLLLKRYPQARFLLPVTTAAARKRISEILAQPEFAALPITLTDEQLDMVCTAADAILVTSGTTTLEMALCKRPMIISYKISPLTYAYVKNKIKVPHAGLPNILLGRTAVPELLQYDAVPEKLAQAVANWYGRPEVMAALEQDFHALHLLLKKDTATLTAAAVLEEARFLDSLKDK